MPSLIEAAIDAAPKISPATRKQYRTAGAKLAEILAEYSPHQVAPRDVAQIKLMLAATPNMANRCLTVLRVVFNYALEMQLVDSNPAIGVKRFDEPERERLLTHAELTAIRRHAPPRLAILLDLMYLTGQRVTDVLRIRMSDITDEGIYFKQRKTGKRLVVKWSPDLRAAVDRAKALCGNVRALTLLHGRTGKAPDYRTTRDQWALACERAGVSGAQLRDLRAMSITNAELQGFDPTALAGHTSQQMTKRYLRSKIVKAVDGPSFGQVSKKAS
jgi:integrase